MTKDKIQRIIGGEDGRLALYITDDEFEDLEPYDFVHNMYSRVPVAIDGKLFHELKLPYRTTKFVNLIGLF